MRQQYLALQAVGGLTIQNSSINLVNKLKQNKEILWSSLKEEVQNSIRETLQAFHLANQENVNPNIFEDQHQEFQHPSSAAYSPSESTMQNSMFSANHSNDLMVT